MTPTDTTGRKRVKHVLVPWAKFPRDPSKTLKAFLASFIAATIAAMPLKSSVTKLIKPLHGTLLPRKTSKNALSVFGHFRRISYQGMLPADEVCHSWLPNSAEIGTGSGTL